MLVRKNFIIYILLIFLLTACDYPLYTKDCKKCLVNINDSKETVEKLLGRPIEAKKNKDGTFTAIYCFSYPVTNNTNGINIMDKPLVYHNIDTIVVLYDNNWKVKNFILNHK